MGTLETATVTIWKGEAKRIKNTLNCSCVLYTGGLFAIWSLPKYFTLNQTEQYNSVNKTAYLVMLEAVTITFFFYKDNRWPWTLVIALTKTVSPVVHDAVSDTRKSRKKCAMVFTAVLIWVSAFLSKPYNSCLRKIFA